MKSPTVLNAVIAMLAIYGIAGGEHAAGAEPQARSRTRQAGSLSHGLVIHEWGTFTALQDEGGRAIPGVNTDDEPVPEFVHRLANLISKPSELAPTYYKGVPRSHRGVTMRLETPVIYFYPPPTKPSLFVDVRVRFKGGWLTEYYPDAKVDAPGLQTGGFRFGPLTADTVGTLEWKGLQVGGHADGPQTDSHVWLAPREVERAASVRNPAGETERYLFYRGVGNLVAPLSVIRDPSRDELVIREQRGSVKIRGPLAIRGLWLANIREDGTVAYRALGSATTSAERAGSGPAERELARVSPTFEDQAYSAQNLVQLRSELRQALVKDGLYLDEAEAMLNTWQAAYFKSPGLRLFFLLPQQWTDTVLPLTCSVPAEVVRSMIGRIEIVTPGQRALIRRISSVPTSKVNWIYQAVATHAGKEPSLDQLWEGRGRFSDLDIPIPEDYRAYLALGRFRNALLLDQQSQKPMSGLEGFIKEYNLGYFSPEESD